MKWRRVSETEVLAVLNDPDRVEDSIDNRCNAYKSLDGRLLKVAYAAEQDAVVVITVI